MVAFKPRTVDELIDRVLALLPDCEVDVDPDTGQIAFITNFAEDQDTGDLVELEVVADSDDEDDYEELTMEVEDDEDMA